MIKRAQIGSMLALLAAVSMWFYVDRILVGFQVADAAARERPRGNLSDLYPRWLGARELLLHHRNPYGDDITIEIQKGYYGRALDPARPNDPKDQQGFAYPVYVVFLLAPFVGFPFHSVQLVFYWTLIALTAIGVWLWLRALRWRLPISGECHLRRTHAGKFCRGAGNQAAAIEPAGVGATGGSGGLRGQRFLVLRRSAIGGGNHQAATGVAFGGLARSVGIE